VSWVIVPSALFLIVVIANFTTPQTKTVVIIIETITTTAVSLISPVGSLKLIGLLAATIPVANSR
jgi:hypothetical protein